MSEQNTEHVVKLFRGAIPAFRCLPGCHDCCGPVPASRWEQAQLPAVSEAKRSEVAETLNCPHLGPQGCQVYDQRPILCRLFGTVESLPCPHGRRPLVLLPGHVEREINRFFSDVPHDVI